MKFRWLFGLIAIVLCLSTVAFATGREWLPRNGVPIRQGWHIEWFRAGEARDNGVNAGEVALVWSDTRFGDRGVFSQVVGTNGELKFGENGLKISDAPGRQEDPGVWPDPDGGWFYAWEDFDIWTDIEGNTQGDSLGNIYCQKIDADGNILWAQDDERGVPVCVAPGIQESVRIVHDGQGGCIIAWKDQRGGDVGDIYAMHILSNGTPDPDWPENGRVVVAEPGAQSNHTADVDGSGGMIIGWKDGREVQNFDIWAQRITPDGDLLWGDGQGIIVCNNASNQDSPKLCPDGQGGAFFTWVDDRNRQETNKDIYAQRVDSDGGLMWGAANEGIPLCTAEEEQINNRIVISEPGTAIVLWEDKRANGSEYDLYAMRINGENAMVKTWQPEQGKPVAVVQRHQQQSRLYPDGQGGAYFVWEDERDGAYPEVDIWIQRLNVNGDPLWQENGIPVCRVDGNMNSPLIRTTADGGAVVAWGDQRNGSLHLYAQRVALDGRPNWDLNGIPIVAGLSMNATNHQILPAINGDNTFAVSWLDGRYGVRGTIPFVQFCADAGENCNITLTQDGIPLISDDIIGGGISPRSIIATDNSIVTVWEDHRAGQNHAIYVQKVDQQGRRIWGPNGIKCGDFEYDQNAPYLCSDGDAGVIVAWKAPTENNYFDIYMQRIDRNGQKVWGDNGLLLTGNSMDELVEDIVADGEGGAVIVWLGADWDLDDGLFMQRVNANGEPQWNDGEPLVLAQEYYKQHEALLLKHPDGFFVTWVDGRDDQANAQSQDDIFAQFIEPDGTFRWVEGGVEVYMDENYHQLAPTAAIATDGTIWVAWEDNRWGGPPRQKDIFIQKLSPTVNPESRQAFPIYYFDFDDALRVCGSVGDQVAPQIISDANNGVWLAWEDYRTGVWSDVYSTHLNENGERYVNNHYDGDIVCDATHKQNAPKLTSLLANGHTGVALVWEDKRATGKEELSNIYVQHMDDYALDVPAIERPNNPKGFVLESVYPNPFNDRSIITFVSPVDGHASLTVFDINGRLVKELASDNWDAGRHLVVFDASGLAAGSYIIQLKADQVQLETKVQLLK